MTFYGGAGSLVLVLLWAYYASQIFLFGASFIAALFAWGTIATSTSFSDLHGRSTNSAFLLLPARPREYSESHQNPSHPCG